MQLEHFLDDWDQRELDEADEVDDLPVSSAERTELLSERIRRSALLLGRYTLVDDTLHALGLDLEHAAFLPFQALEAQMRADNAEDSRLAVDLNATAAANGDTAVLDDIMSGDLDDGSLSSSYSDDYDAAESCVVLNPHQ